MDRCGKHRRPSENREPGTARRRGNWYLRLAALCLGIFLLSGGLLLRNRLRAGREQAAHAALARQVHRVEEQIASQGGGALPTQDGVLPQYQTLWEQNQDLAGWISIPGTAIDYPVMHTALDEEFYLRRALTVAAPTAERPSWRRTASQAAETTSYTDTT